MTKTSSYTAFDGDRRFAAGPLAEVALAARDATEGQRPHDVLVFDDATGLVVDLYLMGSPEEVAARYAPAPAPDQRRPAEDQEAPEAGREGRPPGEQAEPSPSESPKRRGRGRPKLGVVGREVTLLPRHWEWLGSQPGGASVTLRKLVEQARKENTQKDRMRRAREVTYNFLSAMAGDRPGFEEATRALFAGDRTKFEAETEGWPADIRAYALKLAAGAFPGGS